MNNYSAESDAIGTRVLFINIHDDRYSTGYGKIDAVVLREAVSDAVNPDTGSTQYNDGKNVVGYRNVSWSGNKKSSLFVENLTLTCQFDIANNELAYGNETCFREVFKIDLQESKAICNTLSHIEKSMNKLNSEFGYTNEFGSYVARVAKILGIKKFIVLRDLNNTISSWDQINVRHVSASNLNYEVEKMIEFARK